MGQGLIKNGKRVQGFCKQNSVMRAVLNPNFSRVPREQRLGRSEKGFLK